jgi:hypothetical protein
MQPPKFKLTEKPLHTIYKAPSDLDRWQNCSTKGNLYGGSLPICYAKKQVIHSNQGCHETGHGPYYH